MFPGACVRNFFRFRISRDARVLQPISDVDCSETLGFEKRARDRYGTRATKSAASPSA